MFNSEDISKIFSIDSALQIVKYNAVKKRVLTLFISRALSFIYNQFDLQYFVDIKFAYYYQTTSVFERYVHVIGTYVYIQNNEFSELKSNGPLLLTENDLFSNKWNEPLWHYFKWLISNWSNFPLWHIPTQKF